jgi:hypothetical protein
MTQDCNFSDMKKVVLEREKKKWQLFSGQIKFSVADAAMFIHVVMLLL